MTDNKRQALQERIQRKDQLVKLIIEKIGADGVVEVGRRSSDFLEISHGIMVAAVMELLHDEAYKPFYIPMQKNPESNLTLSIKVLAPKDFSYKDVLERKDKFQAFTEADRELLHN